MCSLFILCFSSCLCAEGCPQCIGSIKFLLRFAAMEVSVVFVSEGLLINYNTFIPTWSAVSSLSAAWLVFNSQRHPHSLFLTFDIWPLTWVPQFLYSPSPWVFWFCKCCFFIWGGGAFFTLSMPICWWLCVLCPQWSLESDGLRTWRSWEAGSQVVVNAADMNYLGDCFRGQFVYWNSGAYLCS